MAWGFAAVLALTALLVVDGAIIEKTFTIGVVSANPSCVFAHPAIVVNGQWPGPPIYASDGDTIIVHVVNTQDLPVTIHWHGLAQEGSQWSDGVPDITQCPILKGKNYTYKFQIKGQVGTFWYHAHTAQLRNTVHGAVIVAPSHLSNPEPVNISLTGEFLILAGDWYKETAQQLIDSVTKVPYLGYPLPTALHINGKTLCSGPQVYQVVPNRWYRFRVINTGMYASFNLQIEGHKLVLFEAEGGYLQQVPVTALDVYPGQSYSVLVYTGQKPDNYWVTVSKRFDVEKSNLQPGAALLSYIATGVTPGEAPDRSYPVAPTQQSDPSFQFRQENLLKSLYPSGGMPNPSKLLVLELNSNTLRNGLVVYSINNVTFGKPSIPFLLADYYGNSSKVYSTTAMPPLAPPKLAAANDGPTNIAPTALPVPYGSWVQIVVQNHKPPGGLNPWHLHGTNFHVVGIGAGLFNASKWLTYAYNTFNPPMRNTAPLYDGYWVALRFKAVNPGVWIFHCHLEQHADQGMLAVIKQLPDPSSKYPWLSPPPTDYPKC